jgi:hypothetical protein
MLTCGTIASMVRWIGFIITLGLGATLGLLYGWVVEPIKYVDTAPETLRIDYKSDYVLMVAEIYKTEGDLPTAVNRLALFGESNPTEVVHRAVLFAEEQNYADADLILMRTLETDLQAWFPLGEENP